MKKQALIASAVLAMVVSVSASAQDGKFNPGVYVGVDGGSFSSNVFDDTKSDAQGRHNPYSITSESRNAGVLRAVFGYQFTPNFALETGYFTTGDIKVSIARPGNENDFKVNANGVDLAAVYKFTEYVPGLFMKAGVTYAKVTASNSGWRDHPDNRTEVSGSNTGLGYLFGVGYEYDFSPNWSANGSYTRLARIGGAINDDYRTVKFNANMITAGVKYRF